jgi:hypothetical protein
VKIGVLNIPFRDTDVDVNVRARDALRAYKSQFNIGLNRLCVREVYRRGCLPEDGRHECSE